ncbi:TadE/TadG family type IV pilus assembly protein [Cellulomonas sp. SLBN-39]|uniref:TadE/TadG family type IV pilus assembly protein n=1 Tax=Cellulomonas sp. SLBN-39 TaxID=2768446 RepID=UPI0011514E88|nr:TadE/TadG family type IV pilus assembly protein [Cellulomonas sp. SLBN-39]TQL01860.1 TadE-like protein [Cellulomonas sp. SLBN-39]
MGRARDRRAAGPTTDDRGSMAVEVVVLVPLLLLLALLVVAFGRYVSAEGEVQAMARDAVRAATLERSGDAALAAARATAAAVEPGSLRCAPARLDGLFVAGGQVTVEVSCEVSFSDLGLVGLPGTATVTGTSTAPLDTWRRTGA